MADNRQSESESTVRSRRCTFGLTEALKDIGQELRADAKARIADANFDIGVDAFKLDSNVSPFGSKFDRIRQEIPNHLLQAIRIARNQSTCGVKHTGELNSFGLCCQAY